MRRVGAMECRASGGPDAPIDASPSFATHPKNVNTLKKSPKNNH
jgi:hypothetical protein